MIFIKKRVECVCHYALSHATCQNNPHIIYLFSNKSLFVHEKE